MISGYIKIAANNKKVWELSHGTLIIPNQYNQDSAAKVLMIMKLIDKAIILITINRIQSQRKIQESF